MPHTPAASPSSPSMRFKAFVMPTIQRSVTGTLSAPSAIASAEASPGFVRNADHNAVPDGDDRGDDLQNELDPGAERNEIVHRAGHDNDDAAEQYTLHRLVDARERQHSGEKAGKQRQPAEPGIG